MLVEYRKYKNVYIYFDFLFVMYMLNWRVFVFIYCFIISRYRGLNMCSGQDILGKVMV